MLPNGAAPFRAHRATERREYTVSEDTTQVTQNATQNDAPATDTQTDTPVPAYVVKAEKLFDTFLSGLIKLSRADDTPEIAAMLSAIEAMRPLPALGETVAKMERDVEIARNAGGANIARTIRESLSGKFAALAAYGAPPAPPAAQRGRPRNTERAGTVTVTGDIFTIADGSEWRKRMVGRDNFDSSNAHACGQCAFSTLAAHAGSMACPNYRQNFRNTVAKHTAADIEAHAGCIAAVSLAEIEAYPQVACATTFTRV
jgi:hypothetical protein